MEEKKKFADLKVGDTIWTTKRSYRNSDESLPLEESVVVKVGRKYLTVESKGQWKNERQYEIADGIENTGGYSNYSTHLVRSPEQYAEDRLRDYLWLELTRQWRNMYQVPDGFTKLDILDIASKLGIDLSKVS